MFSLIINAPMHKPVILVIFDRKQHGKKERIVDSRYTVSHFSNVPLIKCKITRKRNMIFLF